MADATKKHGGKRAPNKSSRFALWSDRSGACCLHDVGRHRENGHQHIKLFRAR
jgi:hypothetical protein